MNGIECEEAVKDICEKCFEKYEEMYGEKPINCAFRANQRTFWLKEKPSCLAKIDMWHKLLRIHSKS